jgi:intein/homing endonuclease
MYKVSTFLSESDYGYSAVPLFGAADGVFEKSASVTLLPEVLSYIKDLKPKAGSQYVLVNAMGAGEYYSSNINGDWFEESGLVHTPPNWSGNPLLDKTLGKGWTYGYPTFYNALPYAHHRNKDPSRAYGEVELAVWNELMKRVELVCRVDYDKCEQFGGVPVWDKLKAGQFPDVSMGCLPSGSLITMSDGTQKPIELVRETEMVLTHTGAHRRVTGTMRRHHPGSVFRFNVYGFRRELVVTGNHPLWLVDGEQLRCDPQPHIVNKGRKQRHCTPFVKGVSKGCSSCSVTPSYEFEWRRADEAQVGDYLAFPVPTLSTSGALQGNRSLARLLGYYLAEGHVSNYNDRPREQVNFSLNYEENELAEEIEKLARSFGVEVLWHHEKPEVGSRTVSIVSKTLAYLCSFHCGDGAKTKVLSQEVLHEDPALLLELLGAYLNGDGGTYKGSLYFSTSSEQLAHQLFIALARCGLVASVNKNEHKPSEKSVVRKETTEYQVWVGTDFSWKLERYISKPVRHSIKVRGQRFFYESGGVTYLMAPILEIDEAPHDDDVFNFSVEGDESYVAEGLAVHNSKVCYDLSSITTDWETYNKALATFNPTQYAYPGLAVVEYHKKLKEKDGVGIRGLSITRADYDEWTANHMNRILPDGRKVFVYNPYPRFFDISFVFIGADRTAKVMVFIVRHGTPRYVPSAEAGEKMEEGFVSDAKVASAAALFHGSAEKREVLEPRPAKGQNTFQNQDAVYASTEPLEAMLYAVGSTLKGKTDYAVTPKDRLIIVGDEEPRAGFLHKLPSDGAVYGKGKANEGQAYIKNEVEPLSVKKVTPSKVEDHIVHVDTKAELKKELLKDTKEASADLLLKSAFGFKGAELKQGEIDKELPADKAVPLLSKTDKDLPDWAINALSSVPEDKALGTTGAMGIVLKPREFQRITLIRMGSRDLADEADERGELFPSSEECSPCSLGAGSFLPALARILRPLLAGRSGLAPYSEKRVIIVQNGEDETSASHPREDFRKIGAAYNGYRQALMELVASVQDLLPLSAPSDVELQKLAAAPPESLFTPLSYAYFRDAFLEEVPFVDSATGVVKVGTQSVASVKRGHPSRNT